MAKIIGNTTATPNPRPDWKQTDETKADYIKNKPTILTEEDIIGLIEENADTSVDVVQIQSDWTQNDDTQVDYIKNKPTILTEEKVLELIEENSDNDVVQVQSDWAQTDDTQVDYIKNKPTIIDKFSESENGELLYNGQQLTGSDDGGIITETDPTVPAWAKAEKPPTYTAEDVGALPVGTVIPSSEDIKAEVESALEAAKASGDFKGEDYILTESDKTEIRDAVLAQIKYWTPKAGGY